MMSAKELFAALAAFSEIATDYFAHHFAWAVPRSLFATRIESARAILPVPCNRELRCQARELASHAFCRLDHSTTLPQVLFDCLAGNWIQFAIQITIHQFRSFFAVHLFLLTNPNRQTFPELGARAGEPRHDRTRRNLRDVGYFLVG